VKLVLGPPGVLEVKVVEHGVANPSVGDVAGEGLFPYPLGHPHPLDFGAEAAVEPVAIGRNLTNPVTRREHRKDRLEVGPTDDLHPARFDQGRKPIEILRVVAIEPLHQGATGMEGDAERRIRLEDFEERQIAILIGLLEDPIEVADRLMIMENQ
jgi:hypothetical protein